MMRLRGVMLKVAHTAALLGSGSDGELRARFMSISNALNAALGRTQSSHGEQFDAEGNRLGFTCNGCDARHNCEHAFDPFNVDGDCLAEK